LTARLTEGRFPPISAENREFFSPATESQLFVSGYFCNKGLIIA
jgi:hypothetical protein